jgi:N-carbamoylputrescine amidase
MKVTVCELSNDPEEFTRDWELLAAHVTGEQSELVLLPEMVFFPWFAWSKKFDPVIWEAAVKAHEQAEELLRKLSPACVCGTRPITKDGKRLNESFVWEKSWGYRPAHQKYYLPDEEGFWEASWYERGKGDFTLVKCRQALVGFVICTDIWFFDHSRTYGQKGAHIIACPRATPRSTLEKWLVAGRAASVVSGAFALSSNRISQEKENADLGGQGWIVGPNGKVLGLTSTKKPFLTLYLDLSKAERAKHTYPRYVKA